MSEAEVAHANRLRYRYRPGSFRAVVGVSHRHAALSGEILMSANGYLQLAFYVVVLIALAKPLGAYMARIYEDRPAFLNRIGSGAALRGGTALRGALACSGADWA